MSVSTVSQAAFDQPVAVGGDCATVKATPPALALSIHDELGAVADDWRGFERVANCTAFQTFAWHDAWQRHVGAVAGVRPAIVVGRRHGNLAFILPLAIESRGLVRRLVWHASDLCDYNAPLIASDFTDSLCPGGFVALFAEITRLIAARTPFDAVVLTKMPDTVGGQANPFLTLATTLDASGAHFTSLGTDWDSFYAAKRSATTRRRDRTKRKRLADIGAVRFVTPAAPAEIAATLATLFEQKSRAFARMGVSDLFAKPGVRAFFVDLATAPGSSDLVHVSRLDVGDSAAATNLALLFRGRYYYVLASYGGGPAARFGPGVAHLHDLMAYAMEHGCEVFDFTIGDESYKSEWSEVTIALHNHRRATSALGSVHVAATEAGARVKRMIKQNPTLWRMAVKARAAVRGRLRPAPGKRAGG